MAPTVRRAFVAARSGCASLIGAVERRGRLAVVKGGRRLEPAGPGQAVGEGADAVARPRLRGRGEPIVEAPEAQRGLSDVGGGAGRGGAAPVVRHDRVGGVGAEQGVLHVGSNEESG